MVLYGLYLIPFNNCIVLLLAIANITQERVEIKKVQLEPA
jgi:hypothetical protein